MAENRTHGEIANELHAFAALLAGVEEICRAEEIGGDALHVAGFTCGHINHQLCLIADSLNKEDDVAEGTA